MHRKLLLAVLAFIFGVSSADGGMILSRSFDVSKLDLTFGGRKEVTGVDQASSTSVNSQSVGWEFADETEGRVLTFVEGDGSSMSGLVSPLLGGLGLAATSNSEAMIPRPSIVGRVIVLNSVLPRSPTLDGLIKPS